jgi:hypothetical protein
LPSTCCTIAPTPRRWPRRPGRDARGAYFRAASSARPNETADFLESLLWEKTSAGARRGLDGFLPLSLCRPGSDGKIGQLRIHLVVPASGELNADGEVGKISAHLDGDGLEIPFGRCLAAEIHKRVGGVAVPAPMPVRAEKELRLGGTIPAHPR